MIKKIAFIIIVFCMTGCATIKDKSSGISKITDTCPPKSERTIKNILCKEAK
jgi:hypothetical protein